MRIETYIGNRWQHCADLTGAAGDRQRDVQVSYEADYAVTHLFARDLHALSVRVAVDLGTRTYQRWPAFLIDLLPQGAAQRRLERAAGTTLSEWDLLERGAFNPVGNLRVLPDEMPPRREHRPFTLDEMTARGDAFLDFAAGVGAAVAGASDTQGEAPKFWIVQDSQGRWYPDDGNCDAFAVNHALLKFPVPEAGVNAPRILKAEAAYQRVAARLGLRVTEELPRYHDGALILPRFDRRIRKHRVERLGVESLYSICDVVDSTQALRHDQVLLELAPLLDDFDTELREYLWRDLLNIALGNRDNHGRNTAILKDTNGEMRLAPLFDLGPSFLDARAITRVLRWDGETPGAYDWQAILERLEIRAQEAEVAIDVKLAARAMGDFGDLLAGLPDVMRECEVEADIIEQRIPEIARLASSLAGLPRNEAGA